MKIYFLTFGGPDSNYYDAIVRICSQAREFMIFDKIIYETDETLKNYSDFWNINKDFVLNNKRGFGYWIWKPFLILKTLESMEYGDILLYCDCGCELNIKGKDSLLQFINICKNKKILGTYNGSTDLTHTKMDILKYFNMQNNKESLSSLQIQGCILLMEKCDIVLDLIINWYHIMSQNYNLIDDSPSIEKNFDEFVENRHDQSILNILLKKRNLINYDLKIPKKKRHKIYHPIFDARNKTGISILDDILK